MSNDSKYELPRHIERYLAALSKLYAQDGNRLLQEIIVNAQIRIHEEWSRDDWNGGTYGHALTLVTPESLYLSVVKQKDDIQKQIIKDLNQVHNVQNEFIAEVFLEMEVVENGEWRKDSGLLLSGKRAVPPDATKRIWGDNGFRLFLSHKSEVKKETAILKDSLRMFGVSCFVAHEDIHPTKAWQEEIESALASMDGLAALMTDSFHNSDWTDQEVGFAIARGVPVIAVRLGKDPYGFIGKFQALPGKWETCAEDIAKILINNDRMFAAYIEALRNCSSFNEGNTLAKILSGIEKLSSPQINELVTAFNENSELRGSFGFNGLNSTYYGPGLVPLLNRLGDRRFERAISGPIGTV